MGPDGKAIDSSRFNKRTKQELAKSFEYEGLHFDVLENVSDEFVLANQLRKVIGEDPQGKY